jgi:hypothetical protein
MRYTYFKLKRFDFLSLAHVKESLRNGYVSSIRIEHTFQPETAFTETLPPIYRHSWRMGRLGHKYVLKNHAAKTFAFALRETPVPVIRFE